MPNLPLHFENKNIKIYGDLIERAGAVLLEGLILSPLTLASIYCNSQHLYNFYYTTLLMDLVILAYMLYLPVRYGATPGKRALGLTILKADGGAITYREAFLKYLPSLAIGILGFVVQLMGILQADPQVYDNLPWLQQSQYLKSVNPISLWLSAIVLYGFMLTNFCVVALNKRNRSIGDLIAGTVVVKTIWLDKIAAYREEEMAMRKAEE